MVTVDEQLVELARHLDDENLSAVVNTALAEHVERLGRLASLREMLDRWEADAGPVSAVAAAQAAAAFDQFDDGLTFAP